MPDIDFSSKMILVITAGKIPRFNYDLIFQELQKSGNHLNVRAAITKKSNSKATKADYPGIGIVCDKINLPVRWFIAGIGTSQQIINSTKVNLSGSLRLTVKDKATQHINDAAGEYEIDFAVENWKFERANLEIIEKTFIVGQKHFKLELNKTPEIYSIKPREYQRIKIFGKCKLSDVDASKPVRAEFKIKDGDNILILKTQNANIMFKP